MTGVTQNAVKDDAAFASQLPRDLEGVSGRGVDAGAVIAAVDFEPDVQAPPAPPSSRDSFRRLEVVEDDAQRGATLGNAPDVRDVCRIEWEGPRQVREPAPSKRLRFE